MFKKLPKPVTVDFETFGIEPRPFYPPIPVGVSIKYSGKPARYYGWGHPTANNSTWDEARDALAKAYDHGLKNDGLLFQNAKFDIDVAEVHMGLKQPPWEKIHDTLFLLFLDDPHQKELGLKPSSERLLNLPPDEQDEVADWLIEKQPVWGIKISRSKQSPHYFGKYIAWAPGDIVGKYANGDVERTEKLFQLLYMKTVERGMLKPYNRERELMPILLETERRGVPVDLERLKLDVVAYNTVLEKLNLWVIKQLKADPLINLDSGEQLVEAMVRVKKADPALLPKTPTGKFQTNKEALLAGVTDKQLLAVLKYRTQLQTCLRSFMEPWLKTAIASVPFGQPRIYTTWNQTKSAESGSAVGTRTGRLSSTPSLMNIPKEFEPIFWSKEHPKLVKMPFQLPPLPLVRSYVIPFEDHVLIDRDYSQQEPRILAHFDGGELMEKYIVQPWIDLHDYAKDELEKMGKFYARKPVKNTNLGLIYGMGVAKLATKNDMSVDESADLKKAILKLYPGLAAMYKDMKRRAREKEPIRTWGGREYYCEEPKLIEGRIREFDYKLVNVLIQGSAADCTKEAIIRLHREIVRVGKACSWFILLNVHDQITCSVPRRDMNTAMELMRVCMEGIEFDVPMLSEGAVSTTNWAELRNYDKKGNMVWH
jgi:DNA polymerase I-like protein with 3'-5' exonuclease and polymerase domains